jgi:toxin HigB-1
MKVLDDCGVKAACVRASGICGSSRQGRCIENTEHGGQEAASESVRAASVLRHAWQTTSEFTWPSLCVPAEHRVVFLTAVTLPVIMGSVIHSFRNRETEDIFDGRDTRAAQRACPRALWPVARRKLDQINRVRQLRDLAIPPGNRLERLRGDRSEQHSIRINDQYRICFHWEIANVQQVEIVDYH